MMRRTIGADDLARMSTVNSRRMPRAVEQHGKRLEWVGIGWIEAGEPTGREPLVICDCNRERR